MPRTQLACIGLWGATSSGKTTFLSALRIAALRQENESWKLTSNDADSRKFLLDGSTQMVRAHAFPAPSQVTVPYSWRLEGEPDRRMWTRFKDLVTLGGTKLACNLAFIDCPGDIFDNNSRSPIEDRQRVLKHLADCDGLIYLFDPLSTENFFYLERVLDELADKIRGDGRLLGNQKLPHFLAVCITKFDDPRVFIPARGTFVQQDSDGARTPRVPDELAPVFFASLSDQLVRRSLATHFDAGRTCYFVTSAIGFREGQNGVVNLDDCSNVRTVDGRVTILGEIRPINVLEPIVWLERSISLFRHGFGSA